LNSSKHGVGHRYCFRKDPKHHNTHATCLSKYFYGGGGGFDFPAKSYLTNKGFNPLTFLSKAILHALLIVKQLLSIYFWFYKVTMLESTNATGEGKMQVYF
jgi:hypothetical protein